MYSKANNVDTREEKYLIPDDVNGFASTLANNLVRPGCTQMNFPIEAMKFYHQASSDGKTVDVGRLLFRGLEIAYSAFRQYHHDKLVEQMKKSV